MAYTLSQNVLLALGALLLVPVSSLIPQNSLQSCIQAAGVDVVGPSSSLFAAQSQSWQHRIITHPSMIAHPQTREQVAATLACGVQAGSKMSALGGDHSFGSLGMGGKGTLVISVAAFQDKIYDPKTTLYTVGTGNRVGPAFSYLWSKAGRSTPHVRNAAVGMAGSMTGGGFGTTSRFWGAPMDNLVGIEIMLWNGTILNTSANLHPDLFWATQGAASSFGVMLSMTMLTHKPEFPQATNFTIILPTSLDLQTSAQTYLSVQELVLSGEIPDDISLRCNFPPELLTNDWVWTGYHYGDPSKLQLALDTIMAKMPSGVNITQTTTDFWTQEVWIQPGMLLVNGGVVPPRSFYIQSTVATTDKPLTLASIMTLLASLKTFSYKGLGRTGFFDVWGGQFSNTNPPNRSAYSTAKNLMLLRLDGNSRPAAAPFPSGGTEYMKSLMLPFEKVREAEGVKLKGFANYRDTVLTREEWSSRLYADGWPRLLATKKMYDPKGYFTSNIQSIPVV